MNKQTIFNLINKACKYLPTQKIPHLTRKYVARFLGVKDYSLGSGERQIAKTLNNIRVDHTAKYQMVTDFLKKYYGDKPIHGYDIFCGDRLVALGFELLHLYGQDIYKMNKIGQITGILSDNEMTLKENYEGQCYMYIFKKQ